MNQSLGKTWGLRRLADREGRFKMLAVDQRPPIKDPIREIRGVDEAPWQDVADFKAMLVRELQDETSAMLLDPHYAYPGAARICNPEKGLILTFEDSNFIQTPDGRVSQAIDNWSVEKIKRIGGDAVKVLAWYRPDAERRTCLEQQDFVRRVGAACQRYDLPFVLELLVYPLSHELDPTTGYVEMKAKKPDLVIESVRSFNDASFGVDVFKLESPLIAESVPGVGGDHWEEAQGHFDEMGAAAGRPWVMLSAGAGKEEFRRILTHAYRAGASGYLAGRAIWLDAFKNFPDWQAIREALQIGAVPYMQELNALTDSQALPWYEHECIGESAYSTPNVGAEFRVNYGGFEANVCT